MLLLLEVTTAAPDGEEVPETWPATVPLLMVVDVLIVLVIVLDESTDVEAAVEVPVF